MNKTLPPVLFLLFLLSLWLILSSFALIPVYLLPHPGQVIQALYENFDDFMTAFRESFLASLSGFLMSFVFGFLLSLVLASYPWLLRASLPIFIFLQVVPIVAIAPLLVIWFGFGFPTVLACSVIVSIFPILANSLQGLDSTRRDWEELFKVLGASRFQTFVRLRIPATYPYLWAGAKVSSGLSVVGVIVGEFIAGGGLGALIDSGRTQQRVDLVFAALILSGLLGLTLLGVVQVFFEVLNYVRPFKSIQRET